MLAIQIAREVGVTFMLLSLIMFVILSSVMAKFQRRRHKKILNDGIESEATVLTIGHTGSYVNNLPQLKVQMQVEPVKGRNFMAEARQAIPEIDYEALHSGARIMVKYHPSHPKQVILLHAI